MGQGEEFGAAVRANGSGRLVQSRWAVRESRYGWLMVALTPLFIGLANGSMSSMAVFLEPLSSDLGWLRGQTSFGYLAGAVSVGLGGMAMGYLADRLPLRSVAIGGAASLGTALLLLSHTHSQAEFYLYYMLLGGLGASAFHAPLLANVGNWFERNKGLAIGITTSGIALGQASVIYGSRFLISLLGWRGAYVALGGAAWALLLPLALLMRKPVGAEAAARGPATQRASSAAEPPIAPALAVGWVSMAVIFC